MDPKRIAEYHAARPLTEKAFRSSCYAPHVSMYFDTQGNVLACCQNTRYPVGNVTEQRLPDIWNGPKNRKLRDALEKDRFGAGCQFCEWQISVGNYVNAFTRNFDLFPVAKEDPDWPLMMEFSCSNTCNLECIMCYGILSSSIRARREGLPPLPKAYSEQFFEDLRPFLKHLRFAKFLGGEPFLAAESFKVWELMEEEKASFLCNVTTNGTQWNERVERVLDQFPISICVSMDGTTRETVESIRVNAKFDVVHENFRRFHAYTRAKKTELTLTYCLMRQNWREFGDYLLFADDWDCPVYVNLVREPAHCSLYTLPTEELVTIADALESQGERLIGRLGRNRGIWVEQVSSIRRRVEHATESSRSPFAMPLALVIIDKVPAREESERMNLDRATARLKESIGSAPVVQFSSDEDDRVQTVTSMDGTWFGLPAAKVAGQPFSEVVRLLSEKIGSQRTVQIHRTSEFVDRLLYFSQADGILSALRLVTVPKVSEFGMPAGSVTVAGLVPVDPSAQLSRVSQCEELQRSWGELDGSARLTLDETGVLRSVDEISGDRLNLGDFLRGGMTEFEVDRAMIKAWGVKTSLHDEVTLDVESHTYQHVRPHDIVVVRVNTIPLFEDGRHIGYRQWLACSVVDSARATRAAEIAQETLRKWSGRGGLFRVQHNRVHESTKYDGDVSALDGCLPDELIGQQWYQMIDVLGRRFGTPLFRTWDLRPDQTDILIDCANDTGYRQVRLISVPLFNAAGHFQGSSRWIAVWKDDAETNATRRSRVEAELQAWAPKGQFGVLEIDRAGRVHARPSEVGELAGIRDSGWEGIDRQEIFPRLNEALGSYEPIMHDETPGCLDVIGRYRALGRLTTVRTIELPVLDVGGGCRGTDRLIGWSVVDAGRSRELVEEARQAGRAWAGDGPIVEVLESADGTIREFVGEDLLDVKLSTYVGRSYWDLLSAVKPGEGRYVHWRRQADSLDERIEFLGRPGWVELLSYAVPLIQDAGSLPGQCRVLAARVQSWAAIESAIEQALHLIKVRDRVRPVVETTALTDFSLKIARMTGTNGSLLGQGIETFVGRSFSEIEQAWRDQWGDPEHDAFDRIDRYRWKSPKGRFAVSYAKVLLPPISDASRFVMLIIPGDAN